MNNVASHSLDANIKQLRVWLDSIFAIMKNYDSAASQSEIDRLQQILERER